MIDTANTYGVIYTQTNQVNGKIYVGQTTDPTRRRRNYIEEVAKNSGRLIINAMRKHGANNFSFKIIDNADDQQTLDFLEQVHIERLNAHISQGGYNLTLGGYGSAGLKRTEEDKENKREAALKRWASPKGLLERQQRGDKLKGEGNPRFGKPGTMLGKSMSQSAKDAIRQQHIGKTFKAVQWEITHPSGFKEIITNLSEYCRANKMHQGTMVMVSQGLRQTYKGFLCKKLS